MTNGSAGRGGDPAARMTAVPVVLSEDLTDGATIDGVTIINPLAVGFSVASLLS